MGQKHLLVWGITTLWILVFISGCIQENISATKTDESQSKKLEEVEFIPEVVLSAAENYVESVLPKNILDYLSYSNGNYAFTGVGHNINDSAKREYYINKVEYSGGFTTQCFNDSELEKVCVTIKSGQASVTYSTSEKVYKLYYILSFPETMDHEDVEIEFYVIESGEIYKSSSNTLKECEDDTSKCPPFKISKEEANKILNSMVPLRNDYSFDGPYLKYYTNYEGFSGYVWQGSSCPSQSPQQGPRPPKIFCDPIQIDAYHGEIVHE